MQEPRSSPYCDKWREITKPRLIEEKVIEICEEIGRRRHTTNYSEIMEILYEYIEDNFDTYIDVDEPEDL